MIVHSDHLVGRDWIAVDLDGTLAHTDGTHDPTVIGEPIVPMVLRVKKWISENQKVCIFTARVAPANDERNYVEVMTAIKAWCVAHIGQELPVTCIKQKGIAIIYDDRGYRVGRNTGALVEHEANDLLRSAYQVSARSGAETNWLAFSKRLIAHLEAHNPYKPEKWL